MRAALVLALAASLPAVLAKAKPEPTHAYATPTPAKSPTPEMEVPNQQIFVAPANASAYAAEETGEVEQQESVPLETVEEEEDDDEDVDPQQALLRNPLVQVARHVAHGLLNPDRDPPYQCRHSYSIEIVKRDPLVIYIKNFLQPGEAEHMIAESVPLMARSMVASAQDDATQKNKKDSQRTSSSAFMKRGQDAVMSCIEQRAADIVGEDREHVEGLQVVYYQKSQKYNPHFDYFPKTSDYYQAYTANGGQRTYTFFVYLTDATYNATTGERIELVGGATSFPKLGLSVPPIKGDAVFWTNMMIDGEEDERVLHGGDPVIEGQKMAINIWLREREFKV